MRSNFVETRKLNGHIRLSTNGILIPKYIDVFERNNGIQVSIDGDRKAHDFIRGKGSYEKAVRALKLLDEYGIRYTLSFTVNQENKHCIDHIINLCVETGACTLNFNIYQPIRKSDLKSIRYIEWIEMRKYVKERAEKEEICLPEGCIEVGVSLEYWDLVFFLMALTGIVLVIRR